MPSPDLTPPAAARLQSIDALRGLVILFMLLDHVRETFLLHMQVPDPMDVAVTEPALFFSRTLAHLCAPVFIFLTGLSAFLYGEKHQDRRAVSGFLLKRGLFLVALDGQLRLDVPVPAAGDLSAGDLGDRPEHAGALGAALAAAHRAGRAGAGDHRWA